MGYEWDIFISYTRDELVTDWVHDTFYPTFLNRLRIHYGQEPMIFIDDRDIHYGDAWPEKLKNALAKSRLLLCIWSPLYFAREWCLNELKVICYREKQLNLQTLENPCGLIIPIKIQDGEYFPKETSEKQCKDFSDYFYEGIRNNTDLFLGFQKEIDSLVDEVNKTLRTRIPDWSNAWIENNFFERARHEIVLTDSEIRVDKPNL